MKTLRFLLIAMITVSLFSCKEKEKENQITPVNTLSQSTIEHYMCPDKCENGGGPAAGVCKVCNKTLIHNQAWHDQDLLKNGPLNVPSNIKSETTSPNQPSPAVNAKGVYHYTCKNGCSGGAGSAVKCTTCGETLEHNQAYHN